MLVIFLVIIEILIGIFMETNGFLKENNIIFENIIIFINSICVLYIIVKKYVAKEHQGMRRIMIIAFLIRIVCSYLNVYTDWIFYWTNGDEVRYQERLEIYYYTGEAMWGKSFSWTIFIMGIVYQIFGIQQLILQYVHIILCLISAGYVYEIMCDFGISSKNRNLAMCWMLFEPMLLFSSCVTNREAPILFLITQSLYFFFKWFKGRGNKYILWAVVDVFIAALMHGGVIALMIGYGVIYICYKPSMKRFDISAVKTGVIICCTVGMTFIYTYYGSNLFNKYIEMNEVTDISGIATGETGTAIYSDVGSDADSVIELLLYTPVRALYFMFSPMPWDWSSIKQVAAFITSGLMWFYTFCNIIKCFFVKKNKTDSKYFLVCLFLLLGVYVSVFAWGTRGANAAIRHREKIIGIVVLVMAISRDKGKIDKGMKRIDDK